MKHLNVRLETIKLLEENIGNTLFFLTSVLSIFFFLNLSPQARAAKAKLKSVYTAKETINKTERQPTEWQNIFANDISDKWLISKIYKEPIQLHIKKQTTQFFKCAENLNRYFSKEDIQMANRHMKRYSTLLISREIQIRTTMRCHLTPVWMAINKKARNSKCW